MTKKPWQLNMAAFAQVLTSLFILVTPSAMIWVGWLLGAFLLGQVPLWLRGHPKVFTLSLVSLGLIGLWGIVQIGLGASLWSPAILSLWLLGTLPALIDDKIQALLKSPGRRWWLRPRRKKLCTQLMLSTEEGFPILSHSYDLSEGGVFVPLEHKRSEHMGLSQGDSVSIKIFNQDEPIVHGQARVVRKSLATDTYPEGLGLEFIEMSSANKRRLSYFLNQDLPPPPDSPAEL